MPAETVEPEVIMVLYSIIILLTCISTLLMFELIRLEDDDINEVREGVAKTGVTETTMEPAAYRHPSNNKVVFWDLPGIGTPNNPTPETYYGKVKFGTYDAFLILCASRFSENDLQLAKKVKSLHKPFFFVRTHTDKAINDAKRKAGFDEETMLKQIRDKCITQLKGLVACDADVFLISNRHPTKWDFQRLTKAILDVLPSRQKECLTLSVGLLGKDILERKVGILRGRTWKIAAASCVGAVVPVPGLSFFLDVGMLTRELNFYKSQLGLPEENSDEYAEMNPENQKKLAMFVLSGVVGIGNLFKKYAASSAVEEGARYIPIIGSAIAGAISFSATLCFLRGCLNDLEEIALALLDEKIKRLEDELLQEEY